MMSSAIFLAFPYGLIGNYMKVRGKPSKNTITVSWTTSSISSTRAGGSPSRIKGPLVAKYQLVDLLEYSVSTP
jgi:hypothetical protein